MAIGGEGRRRLVVAIAGDGLCLTLVEVVDVDGVARGRVARAGVGQVVGVG